MSIKDFNEKSINFLGKLYPKVIANKVPWDVTAHKDQFSSTIKNKYKIVIDRLYDSYKNEEKFEFILFDQEGNIIFDINSIDSGAKYIRINKEAINLDAILENIYYAARNVALSLENKVDEATDLIDEDLPF